MTYAPRLKYSDNSFNAEQAGTQRKPKASENNQKSTAVLCISASKILFAAGIFRKLRHTHLLQNGKQRAKLGKAGLKQVQTDKTGKPEPVLMMEVG
jgi:hypothetical protein